MTDAIRHRGPDDEGAWCDENAGVALGFRRLSILDLSAEGHQPMPSASGRYVILFNGEIYNFGVIRAELSRGGTEFRGHSDTEVILAAIERWGITDAVSRLAGMFAIALWDRETRTLSLVRDRIGEKPLYYGVQNGSFLFGSELKALRVHPAWAGQVDRGAIALLLRHGYIPAPYSIFTGIAKAEPGTITTVRAAAGRFVVAQERYWSARSAAIQGLNDPFDGSDADAIEQFDRLLRDVVRDEMVSDVPLGAFLSGGVDSSAIVAIMQAQSMERVRTFTIGFHEKSHNEADHARLVASHLGTDHTELYVTAAETLAVIPRLPEIYDEPFADSSQVPTFLVSQLARQHVTVSLSGDGGDELFGGYTRYASTGRLKRVLDVSPPVMRRSTSRILRSISERRWNQVIAPATYAVPWLHQRVTGRRMHNLANAMACETDERLYRHAISVWRDEQTAVLDVAEPVSTLNDPSQWLATGSFLDRMMYLDLVTYLPDDIMVKVDRASMAVSLETRAPFLHHDVVEFAWRLPSVMKVRGNRTKWLLRRVLDRYVPRQLIERPKMGFGVPVDQWLRGPLREWASDLLAPERLKRDGLLDPDAISTRWQQHLGGHQNWQHVLWSVLMLQTWLDA